MAKKKSKKLSLKSKWLLILGVFLVLFAIFFSAYSKRFNAISKSSQILGWKTYTNNLGGYQISYPSDWQLIEASNKSDKGTDHEGDYWHSLVIDSNVWGKEMQKISFHSPEYNGGNFFYIVVFPNSKNLALAQIVAADTKPVPGYGIINKAAGEMLVNGINAQIYLNFGGDHQNEKIVFTKNNKIYYIQFDESNPNDKDFKVNEKVYREMLSAFTFTPLSTSKFTNPKSSENCKSDSDCSEGKKCQEVGPIVLGQPRTMMCIGKNEAAPL